MVIVIHLSVCRGDMRERSGGTGEEEEKERD